MQNEGVSPLKAFFRNKWVRLVLVLDVVIVIFVIIAAIVKTTRTAVISFNVTPVDAKITIDGSGDYANSGEAYSLAPGTYEVQISHESLSPKTFTVSLEADRNTTITTFLHQDNDFSFYTLRDNFSSFEKLAEIASASDNQTTDHDTSAEAFIANFQESYNLYRTKLPIEYRESEGYGSNLSILKNITIRASYNCDITLCIQALMVGTDSEEFINTLLEEKGFNVEDFEIEYKVY